MSNTALDKRVWSFVECILMTLNDDDDDIGIKEDLIKISNKYKASEA